MLSFANHQASRPMTPLSPLVTTISPSLITDETSYRAMHFCAVIETLYEHKNLEYTFDKVIPREELISLANLVSYAQAGFFTKMKQFLRNWGLQYFLCHYLRSVEGWPIVTTLLQKLSEVHNFPILEDCGNIGLFICGADSSSGTQFLNDLAAQNIGLLGNSGFEHQELLRQMKYVDLCILVKKLGTQSLAIVGEVEGNHGDKITPRYFEEKQPICSFALGVIRGLGLISIEVIVAKYGNKVVVRVGADHAVIKDFWGTIEAVEVIFERGEHVMESMFHGAADIVRLIKFYWRKPVYELIAELRKFIKVHNQATPDTNPLTIPTVVPNIIS